MALPKIICVVAGQQPLIYFDGTTNEVAEATAPVCWAKKVWSTVGTSASCTFLAY